MEAGYLTSQTFFPSLRTLSSEHLTYLLLNWELQTTTSRYFNSLVRAFFPGLKTVLISVNIGESYDDTDNLQRPNIGQPVCRALVCFSLKGFLLQCVWVCV